MSEGKKENEITILISKLPKNYNENFINNLLDRRITLICDIVKRVLLANT